MQRHIVKTPSRPHKGNKGVGVLIKTAWANQRQPIRTADKTLSGPLRFIAAASGAQGQSRGGLREKMSSYIVSCLAAR